MEEERKNQNKKEKCPFCKVSEETLKALKKDRRVDKKTKKATK